MQKRQKKHSSAPKVMAISLITALIGVIALILLNGLIDPEAPQRVVEKPIAHEAVAP